MDPNSALTTLFFTNKQIILINSEHILCPMQINSSKESHKSEGME